MILSNLEFEDKVRAGLVCKDWDQLLKARTVGAKHWDVEYNVDRVVKKAVFTTDEGIVIEQVSAMIVRCATVRNMHCL
jgi:hypothetical protein